MTEGISGNFSLLLSFREERKRLRATLDEIEIVTKGEVPADSIEMIIGELANNAIKANLKRLFFHAKGFRFDSIEEYELGTKSFVENFSHLNFSYYEKAMKLLDVKIEIDVDMNMKRLLVILQSNNAMSESEEDSIRKKLNTVMHHLPEEIHNLYVYYGDDMQGSGLGLTIVVDLIRDMGFDPEHFRVYNEGKYTKARLEFPLSADYLSLRETSSPVV